MSNKVNNQFDSYEQILEYLFNGLSNFSDTGKIKKYDLSNIKDFCSYLGNPHLKYKTVHVAGTNGKGSVSSILKSVLSVASYKVGLYTSPHLYDFRERIRINSFKISKEYISSFVNENISKIRNLELSFFEVTVAMAFKYFADNKVDIAVIETGLGGTFDSTNIIKPILSIITNISHDHKNYLGRTLNSIAMAKAGIIKDKIPVIVGKYSKRYNEVFENAATEKHTNIYYADKYYKLKFINDHQLKVLKPGNSEYQIINTDLGGIYQEENIATALKSIDVLNAQLGLNIAHEAVIKALADVRNVSGLKARWQIVSTNPKIILDVAHNIAGVRKLLKQLDRENYNQLFFIINMMKDKDIGSIIKILPKEAICYFPAINYKRAASEEDSYYQALKNNLKATYCSSLQEAISATKSIANKDDLIIVCGSFFLIKDYC